MGASVMVRVLVLDHTKLGESDSIVTMLSHDGSQLRAIAKGVRKSGSRFGASLEPYTIADIQLYAKRALPMITDAKIITSNKECRADLERSSAAAVVAFSLARISQEGQEEPRIFDLSAAALESMGEATVECLSLLLSAYLFKLLAMNGYRPLLDRCVHCGAPVELPERFSFDGGGVVCDRCVAAVSSATATPQVVGWIDYLLRETFAAISALCAHGERGTVDAPEALTAQAQREILQFTNLWAREHIGARIKPLDFFLSLS